MGNHVGLQIPLPSPKEMLPLLAEKDRIDTTSAKSWGRSACLPQLCRCMSVIPLTEVSNYPPRIE